MYRNMDSTIPGSKSWISILLSILSFRVVSEWYLYHAATPYLPIAIELRLEILGVTC